MPTATPCSRAYQPSSSPSPNSSCEAGSPPFAPLSISSGSGRRDEGRPEPSTEGVLALAESLVSKVKAAEWRDRAEAAVKAGDDLVMRDLRSLVNGSDVARDEASRDLVIALREMLENRVEGHRVAWANEVVGNLDEGHIVRALRLSATPLTRPPGSRPSWPPASATPPARPWRPIRPPRGGWLSCKRSWKALSGAPSNRKASPTTQRPSSSRRRANSAGESRRWLPCWASVSPPPPAGAAQPAHQAASSPYHQVGPASPLAGQPGRRASRPPRTPRPQAVRPKPAPDEVTAEAAPGAEAPQVGSTAEVEAPLEVIAEASSEDTGGLALPACLRSPTCWQPGRSRMSRPCPRGCCPQVLSPRLLSPRLLSPRRCPRGWLSPGLLSPAWACPRGRCPRGRFA